MDLNNARVTHSNDLEENAEYYIEFQCHFIYKFIMEYNGTYTFTNKMYWFGDNVVVCKFKNLENIHEYLDDGFGENTTIKLLQNVKPISEIQIGDILDNNSFVYGLVEIETSKLRKYAKKSIPNKLYHLLTTDGQLKINSVDVKDYNNIIDKSII